MPVLVFQRLWQFTMDLKSMITAFYVRLSLWIPRVIVRSQDAVLSSSMKTKSFL
jgi:hypothetical protein